MQLQIAMDCMQSIEDFQNLAERVEQSIDILEVGTPMLMKFGLAPVELLGRTCRKRGRKVLADTKIMDAGYYEARMAIEAGADIVTVLGAAEDITIRQAVKAARELGAEVMVDMIAVPQVEKRIPEVEEMGVSYICLHHSKDRQAEKGGFQCYFEQLRSKAAGSRLAVAGGICRENISYFAGMKPEIVIVGEGICKAEDPSGSAAYIKGMLNEVTA